MRRDSLLFNSKKPPKLGGSGSLPTFKAALWQHRAGYSDGWVDEDDQATKLRGITL